MVYKYNGILLSHKKYGMFPFATTWMDFEIMLSEISHIAKHKNYNFTPLRNIKKNKWKKKTPYRPLILIRGGCGGKNRLRGPNGWQWGWKLDVWWWAHSRVYSYWIIMLCTRNLCNVTNQCYLIKKITITYVARCRLCLILFAPPLT